MAYLLTINDIVARTGKRTCRFTVPGSALVDNIQVTEKSVADATKSRRYMVLMLPKSVGQFVKLLPETTNKDQFQVGQAAREFVGTLLRPAKDVLTANNFVVVMIQDPFKLDMIVTVDTDHPGLVKVAEGREPAAAGGAMTKPVRVPPVKIQVNVVMVDANRATASSKVEVHLQLLPMQAMPTYSGYAALDFGNTSTALVLSDANQRDAFDLVAADVRRAMTGPAKPVQTALRISSITPPAQPGGFVGYGVTIGAEALEDGDAGWLVLGAKRLLSDRKKDGGGADLIVLENDMHRIPPEDPAELYIGEMLKGMFFHRQARPTAIAVTCPTTFTASEVARLKRTVARAFHRAEGRSAASFHDGATDAFVPLVIDEASAAAFYFAYRDFILGGAGQIPAFRYLYPNGLHMLLYDCGGGTTDLALVRLEARGEGHLSISVLGRAGHRQFGGDFITRQVFRLLKAKLAAVKRRIPEPPKSAGQVKAFLDDHQSAIDAAVPTTFDLGQQQNDDARRRRETTLFLWRLAESLKVRLSAKGAKEVTPGQSREEASELELLTHVAERVGLPDGMEVPELENLLKISRQEVDALIDPEIDRTIAYANDLVRAGMEKLVADQARAGREPPLEIPEVDRVYVVGNASRYPRIRERLLDPEHGLDVRFLERRLSEIRPDDYKNAVAKGAVVALRLREMHAGGQVSWDEDFMTRLPFDLVSEALASAGDSVLFRRGERYSKDLQAWADISPDARTGRPTTQRIRLDRRWPGETSAEPCMIFQFDEPVAGRFVIRYDEERQAFVMHPDRKGGQDELLAVAEPFEQAPYLAPPQSGRI